MIGSAANLSFMDFVRNLTPPVIVILAAILVPFYFIYGRKMKVGDAVLPLWWALSLGACLGGNGTIIGASANVIVAGISDRAGRPFHFIEYMKMAFPIMLMSIVISTVYLWLRYL